MPRYRAHRCRAAPCYGASRCQCSGGAVPVRGGFLPLGVGVRRNGGAGGGSSCARPGAAGTRRGAGQRGTEPARTRVSAAGPGRGPPLTAPKVAGAAREMHGAGGGEGRWSPRTLCPGERREAARWSPDCPAVTRLCHTPRPPLSLSLCQPARMRGGFFPISWKPPGCPCVPRCPRPDQSRPGNPIRLPRRGRSESARGHCVRLCPHRVPAVFPADGVLHGAGGSGTARQCPTRDQCHPGKGPNGTPTSWGHGTGGAELTCSGSVSTGTSKCDATHHWMGTQHPHGWCCLGVCSKTAAPASARQGRG